ncbi:hypothetical protein ACSFA8_07690 [Variovorax sp. RT4R15]|uniref:hypothetical protein n=1 Tax=Variovorax sp. RT4R15 TaxID=3443737 RepID=UPI003F467C14
MEILEKEGSGCNRFGFPVLSHKHATAVFKHCAAVNFYTDGEPRLAYKHRFRFQFAF